MSTAFTDIHDEFMVDPALARPRRGPTYPVFYSPDPEAKPLDVEVLFIAFQPERVDTNIHNKMLEKYGLMGRSGTTYLSKYPGYLTGPERAASAEYAKREVQALNPKVLVAMGNEPMRFCLRWEKADTIPPVSVCHGERFETPRGKPVIAALPPLLVFHQTRVALAYDAAAFTLRSLGATEFV